MSHAKERGIVILVLAISLRYKLCWVKLQAVPFWSVERVRSQRSETGARRNKREKTGGEAPVPKPPSARSPPGFSCSAISRDLSTIQKGTASCSLCCVACFHVDTRIHGSLITNEGVQEMMTIRAVDIYDSHCPVTF